MTGHNVRYVLTFADRRAEELDHDNVTGLLKANLREEQAADKKLSGLAESKVNRKALGHRTTATALQQPSPHCYS